MASDAANDDELRTALAKKAQGRGLKNSEITALRHYEQALARPASVTREEPPRPHSITRGEREDAQNQMKTHRDTLAKDGGGPDLTARVAALEASVAALQASVTALLTLTSGLSRTSVTYCVSGASSSKTILMS